MAGGMKDGGREKREEGGKPSPLRYLLSWTIMGAA